MIFSEKLQVLRKSRGYTQEELAEKLNVSRQAVAKWEAGQAYPDILNLIQLSELFHITVDYLVKDRECSVSVTDREDTDTEEMINFRLEANRNTYAGFSNACEPTRLDSHDYRYEKGDYVYHDTYVGGEQFAGEEAVWKGGKAIYAMNYAGRVLDEHFSGNFLKEALRAATPDFPYRGPAFFQSGEYTYSAKVTGGIQWF
ncbi:MAG: DUF5680 domain-containing protein [Lachnospiraceae bacterium]|nr:DUF5680 domain-containing protein [Lachnospiraceae bacterium]